MYEISKQSMRDFYQSMPAGPIDEKIMPKTEQGKKAYHIRRQIFQEMDCFLKEHPAMPPVLLKSKLHMLIAESFEPVIFDGNPFFFEMGLRERNCWGATAGVAMSPSYWMERSYRPLLIEKHPLVRELEKFTSIAYSWSESGLCAMPAPFDRDHHSLGYTLLFSNGINGLLEQLYHKIKEFPEGSESGHFCQAAIESCKALIRVAEKFAASAEKLLENCADENRKFLTMICETAKRIPANPPKTFYEGLAMLLFTREAVATLEGIGISQFGRVDLLLGDLYEQDLASGRITEEQARELLGLWMMHTDIKFDLEKNGWPETSTCIQLGGCDASGNPVYNHVTRMFIEEHHRLGLVNPKLNCRYSQNSPKEYLQVIGKAVLAGHNNFVLINDDIIIQGLVDNGAELEDARGYVNGGCQETMIEGCGHTEGAALYVSVSKLLELFLNHNGRFSYVKALDSADTFEEFYDKFLRCLKHFFNFMTDERNTRQYYEKSWQQCPLYSATQTGCIDNGKDYVYGGAKYNFSTIALVGFATVADSLFAIKTLVYDQKKVSLEELRQILKENWVGNEVLRRTAIALPKYGHNVKEVDVLADRYLSDLAGHIRSLKNERGGNYIPSLFVYYYYSYFSSALGATPDGRRKADLMSQGCAPSQLQGIKDITMPVKSMQNVDFTVCGGGTAVIDMQLPLSSAFTPEHFASFIRACNLYQCPTIQPNVVSVDDLKDAKIHPENHKNLIVRISGLSAFFVALNPEVQDEIIARNQYQL